MYWPESLTPPTLCDCGVVSVAPGITCDSVVSRPVPGMFSSVSRWNCVCCRVLWVSTSGASPVTVIVSSSAPTPMSALTVAVKFAGRVMPSRTKVLKPGSVNVTV